MAVSHYEYLKPDQVALYLKEKELFPADTVLKVEDLHETAEVEGFVNLLYRISDPTGKSVVLKQVLNFPHSRAVDEANNTNDVEVSDWTLDIGRLRIEISVLIFWNSVYPGICPEIYLFDEPNSIIVMEDLSDLSLLRFELSRMKRHPLFTKNIGCFLARNLFYSSNLHLTTYKRNAIRTFFDNPEYAALDPFLFEECIIISDHRSLPESVVPHRRRILDNPVIQKELLRLRELFLNDKECLIHTDLHASNIMIDADHVKIIDTEFAGFGPIAQDFGRLTASLCLNYCSWFADDGIHTETEKKDYQNYLLSQITELYGYFEDEFKNLCTAHKESSYRLKNLDSDAFLETHFVDSMAYTALNAASRIGDRGLSHDLSRLPLSERFYPQHLILTFCEEILGGEKRLKNAEELADYLRHLSTRHPRESY